MKGDNLFDEGPASSPAEFGARESVLSEILRERTRSLQEHINQASQDTVERARHLAQEIHALNHHPEVLAAASRLRHTQSHIMLTGRWEHSLHFVEKSMTLIGRAVSISDEQDGEKRALALTGNGIEILCFPLQPNSERKEWPIVSPAITTRSLIGAAELGWDSIRSTLFSKIASYQGEPTKACR